MSVALRTGDNLVVLSEVSRLSIARIMDARALRGELSFQLDQMRNSYRWFKATRGVDGRIRHMQTLKKLGAELKVQLDSTPYLPALFELVEANQDDVLGTLSLMIIQVCKYFNTSEIMSEPMVKEVAMRIALKFGSLTLEDIALCLHQAQNGDHGKIYNRVDGAVIMDWLHKYSKQYQELGMERNLRIHNQGKTGIWKPGHEHRIIDPKRIKELM